jgi:hypothetical protein
MADFTIFTEEMKSLCFELKQKWNVKAQFITASIENAAGESKDVVTMAAYGFPYESLLTLICIL